VRATDHETPPTPSAPTKADHDSHRSFGTSGLVLSEGIDTVAVSPRAVAFGCRFRGEENDPVELHGDDHELKADCAEPMETSERVGEKGRGESKSVGSRTWERLRAWMLAEAPRSALTLTRRAECAVPPVEGALAAACSGTTSS